MPKVPEDERRRIVGLCLREYSRRAISAMRNRPLATVNRVIQAYRNEGRIGDAPWQPRCWVITKDNNLQIVAGVAEQPKRTVREVQAEHGLNHVSATTVKRRLYEVGLRSQTAAKKPLMRSENKAKRLQFAEYHAHWSASLWKRVVFTKQCTFSIR